MISTTQDPSDPQSAVRASPQAGDVRLTKRPWGRRAAIPRSLKTDSQNRPVSAVRRHDRGDRVRRPGQKEAEKRSYRQLLEREQMYCLQARDPQFPSSIGEDAKNRSKARIRVDDHREKSGTHYRCEPALRPGVAQSAVLGREAPALRAPCPGISTVSPFPRVLADG